MDELEDLEQGPAEAPSKSQLKREMHVLQGLAERMVALPRVELERLALSAATWAAIDETPRIKDLRALRRHYKRIAKLLARDDTDAVHALLHEKEVLARREAARHHVVECWRDRLIEEGDDALRVFLEECPGADRQQLRSLVRAAQRDREKGRPESARKLFRMLREALNRAAAA
jgi:ribosome-associated protein